MTNWLKFYLKPSFPSFIFKIEIQIEISIDLAEPLRANWRHVFSYLINVLDYTIETFFLINATSDLFSADNNG